MVAAYNTLTGYYKIAYRDGSTEELTQYQVNATAIVTDAPDDEIMWFHDDGQYGLLVGGKAPTARMGELYHIDIPETRYGGCSGPIIIHWNGFHAIPCVLFL